MTLFLDLEEVTKSEKESAKLEAVFMTAGLDTICDTVFKACGIFGISPARAAVIII